MKKDWKYEIARDLMAFGSIIFYLLVLVRSTIGEYMTFVYQLLIAVVVLILLSIIIKNSNYYILINIYIFEYMYTSIYEYTYI